MYDLAGRLVRVVADRPATAGPVSLAWDGRDDRRQLVPPGLYMFRATMEGDVRTAHESRMIGVVY